MKPHFISIILIISSIFFISCKSDAEKEKERLKSYLESHKITSEPTKSGLYYIEKLAGTGTQAKAGDIVSVHYTGTLLNGEKFDSSYDRGKPFEFTLGTGTVIRGWDEGIAYMKEQGKATLIIPSDLAYGASGQGTIPPYATLIFNVELIDVK